MSTKDVKNVELYESSTPIQLVYPEYNVLSLPDWIIENIDTARVYGNKKRCIILPDGRKYHMDNILNEMSGRDWTLFINSVFETHYPTKGKNSYAHDIRKLHPTPKPPQLMYELINFFTKSDDLVFDYFAGVGGTMLGASLSGRDCIGFELNPSYIEAYKKATKALDLSEQEIYLGDSLELLGNEIFMKKTLRERKIGLVLLDPPYANMMSRKKTGADVSIYGKNSTPFTSSNKDLGNMTKKDFLLSLKKSVELTLPYIKRKGYIVIFIKDLQPSKKEVNLLHAEVISVLNEIQNIYYKGMKIWVDGSAKLYPYGYPFCFVANQTHQYILVFRKEK